jgi:hypothetical protein
MVSFVVVTQLGLVGSAAQSTGVFVVLVVVLFVALLAVLLMPPQGKGTGIFFKVIPVGATSHEEPLVVLLWNL